ncbi:zf-MYND domain containing protein [Pyrenophora teres f. maculata]|nr:zf-MYND domain containing protein [Pyrenophora teres f. maculata]
MDQCAKCKKTAADCGVASLKRCAKCKSIVYCGRDCQKAHYKAHKAACNELAAGAAHVDTNTIHSDNYSAPRLRDLEMHVPNPFTRLDQGKYLHDRPEKDVYKLLIDSFRMRQQDDDQMENKRAPNSVYTGAASSIEPFRKYLAQAATRPGLLPPLWTPEKQRECEAFGESSAWQDLRKKVTKAQVIQHYGDEKAPMQLRMLAEVVYGAGSLGQNGASMRAMLRSMESGGPGGGMHASMININNMFGRGQ